MTALFGRRKVLASTETKPGRSPKNVDYVGAWPRLCLAGGSGAAPAVQCLIGPLVLWPAPAWLCVPTDPALLSTRVHLMMQLSACPVAGLEAGSDRLTPYVHSMMWPLTIGLPSCLFLRRPGGGQRPADAVRAQPGHREAAAVAALLCAAVPQPSDPDGSGGHAGGCRFAVCMCPASCLGQ